MAVSLSGVELVNLILSRDPSIDATRLKAAYSQELKARKIHGQVAIDGYEEINRLIANNALTVSMKPNVFVKDIRNANNLENLKNIWTEMNVRAKNALPTMQSYYDAELIKVLNKLKNDKNLASRDFINFLISNAGNEAEMQRIGNIVNQCGNKGQKMNFAKKLNTIKVNIAEGQRIYNNYRQGSRYIPFDPKANESGITTEQWKDFFEASYNEKVEVGGNKPVVQNLLNETKESGEITVKQSEKVGNAIKEGAEEGAKAARKIGPWGWVGIGAAALIAIIAGVSAHNKNKQQQLNAVA